MLEGQTAGDAHILAMAEHDTELEQLVNGLKKKGLASQVYNDGLPTWILRPLYPL